MASRSGLSEPLACVWPLAGGGYCRRRVSEAGQLCATRRVSEAAARAATARAAQRQRRARPERVAPPLADEGAALVELDARLRVPGDPDGVAVPVDRKTFTQDVVCLITHRGPLDISFVPDGTTGYDSLAPAAVTRPLGNHPGVPIADLADIIESEAAAGRARDLTQLPALRRLLNRLRPPT